MYGSVTNASNLINLRVAFDAINDRRLPLAPLVYTLVKPSVRSGRSFFEKQKLTGPNFIDWYRQLRIVLSIEDKLHYLEQPIPPVPEAPKGQQIAPEQAEHELLQTTRDFHSCKQEERQSVSSYVLKMKGYIDNLKRLGHPNYNMHNMGKTVNELHAMLKLHEQTLNLPKSNAPALHAIQAGKVQKGHCKRNCPQYLAELMKKKKNTASGVG
nr:hypothetical protein [Tanacetum cinerariifolium]